MHDSIPVFPEPRRRQEGLPPLRLEAYDGPGSYEQERSALVAHWRLLCEEMQVIDRRLEELEALVART